MINSGLEEECQVSLFQTPRGYCYEAKHGSDSGSILNARFESIFMTSLITSVD
jgi:hypothetical protein